MHHRLEIAGVQKRFGGVLAADSVSLTVAAGELLALVGPNGCGKTSLFNLITGFLRPDAGSIRFAGDEIIGESPEHVTRRGIVRKFQVPSVFESLSLQENIAVARYARTFAAGEASQSDDAMDDSDTGVLARVGLAERGGELAGSLAHGQKQWLEIAMALACRPRLLLLDEPTAGMTRGETLATAKLLTELRGIGGLSIIAIEHDLHFVAALDCRVAAMIQGRVVVEGTFAEVGEHAAVREAYLGQAHA